MATAHATQSRTDALLPRPLERRYRHAIAPNNSNVPSATGPLTALAGYGPDGTPGRLIISESGFLRTTFKGATADAFPAEYVEVRAIGK